MLPAIIHTTKTKPTDKFPAIPIALNMEINTNIPGGHEKKINRDIRSAFRSSAHWSEYDFAI
jgi:hypothetical protein